MKTKHILATIVVDGVTAVYTISGVVYDADGSTAVEGATVALGALTAVSGVDGTYTISDVPAGTSGSMTCTKTGYSWTAKTIAAMSGNLTSQNYTNAWWAFGGIAASCLRAYQPIANTSLANSYVNLVTPGTGDAVPGTAPTWNATDGWIFASATPTLDTGVTPDTTYSMAVRFSQTSTTTNAKIIGTVTGYYLQPNRAAADGHQYVNKLGYTFTPKMTSGVLGLAGRSGFVNGAWEHGPWADAGTISGNIIVGGRACAIQAVAIYNATITNAQMIGVQNAMAALANP